MGSPCHRLRTDHAWDSWTTDGGQRGTCRASGLRVGSRGNPARLGASGGPPFQDTQRISGRQERDGLDEQQKLPVLRWLGPELEQRRAVPDQKLVGRAEAHEDQRVGPEAFPAQGRRPGQKDRGELPQAREQPPEGDGARRVAPHVQRDPGREQRRRADHGKVQETALHDRQSPPPPVRRGEIVVRHPLQLVRHADPPRIVADSTTHAGHKGNTRPRRPTGPARCAGRLGGAAWRRNTPLSPRQRRRLA